MVSAGWRAVPAPAGVPAAVQRAVPGVRIFDGNQGLALHLIDILQTNCLETAAEYGVCEYHTTSQDPEILRRLKDFARRVEG